MRFYRNGGFSWIKIILFWRRFSSFYYFCAEIRDKSKIYGHIYYRIGFTGGRILGLWKIHWHVVRTWFCPKTPALTLTDGVDFIPLPTWKIFMIQFLNIAGLGPIFGAIMGAQFGTASYLWIVFGTILPVRSTIFCPARCHCGTGGKACRKLSAVIWE